MPCPECPHCRRKEPKYHHACNLCHGEWQSRLKRPVQCTYCKSPNWDREVMQKYQHQCLRCTRSWESETEKPVRCTYCKSLAWTTRPATSSYQIHFQVDENNRYKRGLDGRVEMRLAQSLCLCGQRYNRKLKRCPACDRRGASRFVSKVLTKAELLDMSRKKAAGEIDYIVQGVKLAGGLPEIDAYRKSEGEKIEGAVPATGV